MRKCISAAIMLKMGAYGFLRFSLPILPQASQYFAPYIIGLSLVAIVYIGFVAIIQQDMKKLIAYSSIAHMGFVTLGLFSIFAIVKNTHQLNTAVMGFEGAIIQMISHGVISAPQKYGKRIKNHAKRAGHFVTKCVCH